MSTESNKPPAPPAVPASPSESPLVALGRETIRYSRVPTAEEVAAGAPLEEVPADVTPANGSNGLNGSADAPRRSSQNPIPFEEELEAIRAWQASPADEIEAANADSERRAEADVEAEVRQRLYEEERARWGGDFISEYTAWADVVELPREVHTAVAIQMIASLLNHNGVKIQHSNFMYPMDLWQLVITPSGGGRSEMIRGVKRLVKKADLHAMMQPSDWASYPAMVQHFAEIEHSLLFRSEFAEMLEFFDKNGGKRWFTDRYDDTEPPDDRKYRVTGKEDKDNPWITFPHAPRINLIAASSDGWFFNDLKPGDSSGGFLTRWMIVRSGKLGAVPTPKLYDTRVEERLLERLKHIAQIRGVVDISEILRAHDAWYIATLARWETTAPKLGRLYFSRHRGIVLKLATVYEVSRSGTLHVSLDSWSAAVRMSAMLEESLFELLVQTGMNNRGWEISEVEKFIQKNTPSRRELGRAFRSMPDLWKHVEALTKEHVVRVEYQPTSGRPKEVYIHCDAKQAPPTATPDPA